MISVFLCLILFTQYNILKKVKLLNHVCSLQPHGLQPTRIPCPWDSPGKNTGVGCHFLLQGIFPTQGSNLGVPHCWQMLCHLSHQESSNSQGPSLFPKVLRFQLLIIFDYLLMISDNFCLFCFLCFIVQLALCFGFIFCFSQFCF